jgi:hypothetical protein
MNMCSGLELIGVHLNIYFYIQHIEKQGLQFYLHIITITFTFIIFFCS